MFEAIIGHEPIKEYLAKALTEKRVPNTLLFSGPEGVGKRTLALHLTARLMQTSVAKLESGHAADFHFIVPEGKSGLHSIETFREAIARAHEAPFEAPAKVFLVEAMDRMQPAAANALLKSLEEPQLDTYWMLITDSANEILPTILSRCVKLNFSPLACAHIEQLLQRNGGRPESASFAHGSISRALTLTERPESLEAEKKLLSLLEQPISYPQLIQTLETIEKQIETEDPLLKQRLVEGLFTTIAYFCRDQELRRIDPSSPHLFFPERSSSRSFLHWEEKLAKSRLAFERNIKLSHCLEMFLTV